MTLKLTNVRLSFPALFSPKSVQEGGEPKYSASLLLNKETDTAQILAIRNAMSQVATEKWAQKIPANLKRCLHEGTEKEYDGYGPDNMFLSTSATIRPTVVDRDRSPLTADDGKPYAGCMVHAVVRLWAQDNQFGKRINAQLQGVQFASDGEAFGAAPFNAEEYFDDTVNGVPATAPVPTPKVAPDSGKTTLSAKTRLKNKFKSHPDFGKTDLTAENVNNYFKQLYEHDLNELSEDEAKAGLEDFDAIVDRICDTIEPF